MMVFKKICLSVCVFLVASMGYAQEGFDDEDEAVGRIDYVDLRQREIVIDDWVYRLALDLKVHGKAGLETDFALQEGREVRFEINPATSGQNITTIADIWILQD